jgi:ATP phosphoribosyltransferase regulatory subunit HisZ
LNIDLTTLSAVERLTLGLRSLYESRGYRLFTMNRLEEYSLYVENMDFLQSSEIIVFSDLDGRLMALKPDITLSIAKSINGDSASLEKLYYHENVFRPSPHAREFREIAQTGLECIGAVTAYDLSETLFLAQRTLAAVDVNFVLDVSHLGFVSAVMEELGADGALSKKLLGLLQKKAPHEMARLAASRGMGEENVSALVRLATVSGEFDRTMQEAESLCHGERSQAALQELAAICKPLLKNNLRLDFSIVSDMQYYNGVVFQGFVPKVPEPVLFGGQYDLLLEKMGKRGKRAAGFALYLDGIERGYGEPRTRPAKTTILYDEQDDPARVFAAVQREAERGGAVRAVTNPADAVGRVVDIRKAANHA